MDVPGARTLAGLAPNERVLQGISADTRVPVPFFVFRCVCAAARFPSNSSGNLGNAAKPALNPNIPDREAKFGLHRGIPRASLTDAVIYELVIQGL